jgi:hypothetical protein
MHAAAAAAAAAGHGEIQLNEEGDNSGHSNRAALFDGSHLIPGQPIDLGVRELAVLDGTVKTGGDVIPAPRRLGGLWNHSRCARADGQRR